MRVAVLGAGVVGTTTAYQLALAGNDVVLIDQAPTAGSGATSGNAGLVTAGDSTVWASPSTLRTIPRVLVGRDPSMRIDRRAGAGLFGWGARFVRECAPARNGRNVRASHALSTLSLKVLRSLIDEQGIGFDLESNGLLVLFDNRSDFDHEIEARALLNEAGEVFEFLDQQQLFELEPSFARSPRPPRWAIFSPNDMSGDSLAFTRQLLGLCTDLGVETRFDTTIEGFVDGPNGVAGAHTSDGSIVADAYVVCLGHRSPVMARGVGDRLAMIAASGFSITADILDDQAVPRIAAIDESRHVAFSRAGNQLRITSSAVIGTTSEQVREKDLSTIRSAADALFPDAVELDAAPALARARPVMARNRPAIGRGRDHHVFYNTGHGPLGWTQANGSAALITAIIGGTTPPIDPADYAL